MITDSLPDETGFIDASPGYSINSRTVTWNIGTIADHSTKCVWLLVLVRPETANGTIIHNEALATNSENSSAYTVENTTVCGGCCFDVKITGGFGYHVNIINNCTDNATNLNWDVTLTGGVIPIINNHISGTIINLSPSDSTIINSGFVFGLGKITITVIVDDCPPFIATANMILFFITNVQQIPHLSYSYSGCGC
jgi:hypothetical protein